MRRLVHNASMVLRLSARSAVGGGSRTLFVLTVMAGVIATALLLLSFLAGLRVTLTNGVVATSGHVLVAGLYKAEPGPGRPALLLPSGWQEVHARLSAIDGVERVSARSLRRAELVGPKGTLLVDLEGVDLREDAVLRSFLSPADSPGSATTSIDEEALDAPGSILIFSGQAERLGVAAGDQITVRTHTVSLRNTAGVFTVAGVLGERGMLTRLSAYVGRGALNELIGVDQDRASAWYVFLDDPRETARVLDEAHTLLGEQSGAYMLPLASETLNQRRSWMATQSALGIGLHLSDWRDELQSVKWLLSLFQVLGFVALLLMLIVVGIGVMNVALVAVQERRAEIGTLRAMGMGRLAVGAAVVTELTTLALASTVVGAVVGLTLIASLMQAGIRVRYEGLQVILCSDTLRLSAEPAHVVAAGCALVIATALGCLWPSWSAARLPPVESMERSE